MSRESDERELRKLEYLESRGVANFSDVRRRKEIARRMAIEDFEKSEGCHDPFRAAPEPPPSGERNASRKNPPKNEPDKKGTSN